MYFFFLDTLYFWIKKKTNELAKNYLLLLMALLASPNHIFVLVSIYNEKNATYLSSFKNAK
jgi:hypothetical protein